MSYIVQTYGGPEVRGAIHLVIFKVAFCKLAIIYYIDNLIVITL